MRCLFILLSMLCAISHGIAQVFINPAFERTALEVIHPHIDEVEITEDSVTVYWSINFHEEWLYDITHNMYLEDIESGKKYYILSCKGISFDSEKEYNIYNGLHHFILKFPAIKNLRKFNLVESSEEERYFNIYGVDLYKAPPSKHEEYEYKQFCSLSDFYELAGNVEKYLEYENKELEAAQYLYGLKSMAAAICYQKLSYIERDQGNYPRAIDLSLQALESDSIHWGVNDKVYAVVLENLAQVYLDAGKEQEAFNCAQKCIRIRTCIEDEDGYLNDLYNLTLTAHNYKEFTKVVDFVRQELDSLPKFVAPYSPSIILVYKGLASKYSLMNNYDSAIDYCSKALDIIKKNNAERSEDYAELLALKCKYQHMGGLYEDAILSGEVAKQLFEDLEITSKKYAELLIDLAWAYGMSLDYEKSIQLELHAADIYLEEEDWASLAELYGKISIHYQFAEKLYDAEKYIKKAIETLDKLGSAEQYIMEDVKRSGNNIIYNASNIANVKRWFNTDKASFLQTLANIYSKQNKYEEAINAELKCGIIIKDMNDEEGLAQHLGRLSFFYLTNNQKSEGIACAEQLSQILKEPKFNSTNVILGSLESLALTYTLAGDTAKAIHYAEGCVTSDIYSSLHGTDRYILKIKALSMLGHLLFESHNYPKAEHYMSEALELITSHCGELVGMATEQKQRLWAIFEPCFLLYRQIIEKSNRDTNLISKLYDYALFSKNLLLDTYSHDGVERMNTTWKDIQQRMSDEDIAIEFIFTNEGIEHTVHALVVDKYCPSPRMITLINSTQLEEIKQTTSRDIRDIVGELIWRPILSQYSQAKNIYFSPDGVFHLLPIEYYRIDGSKYLFEDYNIIRLSSTKEFVEQDNSRQHRNAVLYGGLDYNQLQESTLSTSNEIMSDLLRGIADRGGFEPLPNTQIEIQEISRLLQNNDISTIRYTGEDGTEKSFRRLSSQDNSIIHLATHGMYVDLDKVEAIKDENNFSFLKSLDNENDPVMEDAALTHSFLVMSGGNKTINRDSIQDEENDGILTSEEISRLDLNGTDLVVLSACESGLGDVYSSGIYGLQRGFKKAGVNTILMSLDKVDDEATKILMVAFYKNLMEGKTKLQSLKNAQKHLREVENGKYDDPKYWASFIMLDGLN